MNRERPTLAELRARVHKDRSDEIGNWLARRIGRPSAVPGTWLAIRLGLSAHQVTGLALGTAIMAAGAIGSGGRPGFIAGVVLAHLAFWLDHVDGQVARWRGSASLDGVYLDYLMHHASSMALAFGAGYGLAARTGRLDYALAGFAAAVGWALLSLHNDCRYKAFFQRLKSSQASYRVHGGAGGRPAPPASWPRRGWAALSWPAYKSCEPHMVLIELTGLGLLACLWPDGWMAAWSAWIIAHAVMAPILAALRILRSIKRESVETEFARWFRPIGFPASDWTVDTEPSITKVVPFATGDCDLIRSKLDQTPARSIDDERTVRLPEPSPASAGWS